MREIIIFPGEAHLLPNGIIGKLPQENKDRERTH